MDPGEARALLERYGAILSGHFELTSGRHSDLYVQKARILEHPKPTMALAQEMRSWYDDIDVVVSPAVGAIVLGFAVAVQAGARFVFAEREEGDMQLRRGFTIESGERALVVEDVITTGGSAEEVYDLVGRLGAERLGVAAMVDRSQEPLIFSLKAILRVDAESWLPEECPLCRDGKPLDAPGSRHLGAG
jgi:orotate phosphoribosyltransferase